MKTIMLPLDWQLFKAVEICEAVTDGTHDSPKPSNDGFPLITSMHLKNGTVHFQDAYKISYDDYQLANKRSRVDLHDVLFSMIGSIGSVAIVSDMPFFAIKNVGLFKTGRNKELGFWLYYFLQSAFVQEFIKARISGTSQKYVPLWLLRDLPVALPPLRERNVIIHILQTVQNAIQSRRKELALERERKATLMQHLFTHGTWGEATKQTEIGEMPADWALENLGTLFYLQLGKMLSPKAKTGQSPKPYMRNANVQWGYVDCTEVFEMDFDTKEAEKFRLQYGDILVCEGGEVGRTAIWKNELSECYFQKAIHRLRPKNAQMEPFFFLYHMEHAFRFGNIYGIAGTQTTIAHLPQDKLSVMLIPKPSLEEQQEIASALQACDSKIAALEKEITLQEELFRALLEELMSGRLSALPLVE